MGCRLKTLPTVKTVGCRKESLPTVKTMGGEAGVYLHPDGLSHYALLRINKKVVAEIKAKYTKNEYILLIVPIMERIFNSRM